MTEQKLSELSDYPWMPSRIPLRDALSTFVPKANKPEPIIEEMTGRLGTSVWYEVEGGHKVLMLYDGGKYDASRFTIEPLAWDYEDCNACGEHVPAKTLCYVTKPGQPYYLLCSTCYERHVASKAK